MNYPIWQQKVREAQEKYQAIVKAAEQERHMAEMARLKKQVDSFRAELLQIGLELPESDTGMWEIDGFHLRMVKSAIYATSHDLYIGMKTDDVEISVRDDFEIFERGYQQIVWKPVTINTRDALKCAADIAAAFDDLPAMVAEQERLNQELLDAVRAEEGVLSELEDVPEVGGGSSDLMREMLERFASVAMDLAERLR